VAFERRRQRQWNHVVALVFHDSQLIFEAWVLVNHVVGHELARNLPIPWLRKREGSNAGLTR
jgi:hypothetical protein